MYCLTENRPGNIKRSNKVLEAEKSVLHLYWEFKLVVDL